MSNTEENTRTVEQANLPELARQVRHEREMTQQQVADRLGVTKASVSRVERNAGGSYLNLQKRILSEIGGYRLRGPLWEITEQ